jgi:hypothetical protein
VGSAPEHDLCPRADRSCVTTAAIGSCHDLLEQTVHELAALLHCEGRPRAKQIPRSAVGGGFNL